MQNELRISSVGLYPRPQAHAEADFESGHCLQRRPSIPVEYVRDSRGGDTRFVRDALDASVAVSFTPKVNHHGLDHLVLGRGHVEAAGPAGVQARGTAGLRSHHVTTVAPGTSNALLGVVVPTLRPGRKRFSLATKGTKNDAGDRRFRCPVKAPGSALECPLVGKGDEQPTAKGRWVLRVQDVADFSAAPPAICRQASVTIKNSVEDGARWLQQGPAYGTPEWQDVYGQRNMIESRNDKLKNARGVGIGDPTMRLMRGWAGQLLATAISCVAVNVLLIVSDSAWFDEDCTDNDPTPRGRNELDRKRSDRALAGTFQNAPPVAA